MMRRGWRLAWRPEKGWRTRQGLDRTGVDGSPSSLCLTRGSWGVIGGSMRGIQGSHARVGSLQVPCGGCARKFRLEASRAARGLLHCPDRTRRTEFLNKFTKKYLYFDEY